MRTVSKTEINEAGAALDRDGYVVIRGVVDPGPLSDFANQLDIAFTTAKNDGHLFEGGGSMSGHLNCFPGRSSRFIHDAISEQGILDLIQIRAPETLGQMRATTNYNLPKSSNQHFHSDGLYTDAFLICNVAVVDTDLSNGAIEIIPGTHKRFYKFWRFVLERKHRKSERVCMKQGDVLVRVSTMWHRGTANLTDDARPMMSLTFGEASAPEGDPFANNGGEIQFTPNWYGTDRRSQIKERAFVFAPWLQSTLRFGRSLVGNKGYDKW